ncbi:hypothetical protein [Terasakiella sp. SH-1]|uniref:hypothetical protein n=1 Tax=Terasakiella sp. SH-1 TaxID=2560057 RepID=UPI001074400F|nr:hypothetical protein [Terasakiella sp. SH-1]
MNRDAVKEHFSEHCKLATLCILEQCPAYSANMRLLQEVLREHGLNISSDEYKKVGAEVAKG